MQSMMKVMLSVRVGVSACLSKSIHQQDMRMVGGSVIAHAFSDSPHCHIEGVIRHIVNFN